MRQLLLFLGLSIFSSVVAASDLLPRVLTCGRVGEAGGLAPGDDLTRVTVSTTDFPRAICNDGTPAVFYVAPFQREEDRNKWVIFLQGGGGCRSGQPCAERWCSVDTNFGMDKMSTAGTRPSIRGEGIMSPSPRNHFATWNRVLVYYCSSDTWAGTNSTTLTATAPNGTANVSYLIHFKGHYIVEAVIDTLRRGSTRKRPVRPASTQPATLPPSLPDLDDATDVLFAGSSAGGGGVRNNMDRIAAKLRRSNPDVDFRAAIDATFGPQNETLDWTKTTMCAADPVACRYDTFFANEWNGSMKSVWGFVGDDSCLSWHARHEPGTEWRCIDDSHLIFHHLTTPFFLRQDLQDDLISGNFAEAGFGTRVDYGRLTHDELEDLVHLDTFAEEGSVRSAQPPLKTPGVFGPQCRHHESFARNEAFFDVRVRAEDNLRYSFNELVSNWWRGNGPTYAVRAFVGGGAASDCP